MIIKKETIVGVSSFVIFLIVFGLWQTNREKRKYREKGILTTGTVLQVKDNNKKRPYVSYKYYVGSEVYNAESPYPEFKSNIEAPIKNKIFPVIYINDNPGESEILLSRAKFKRFGLPFPDSLSWTRKLEVP